MRSQRLRRFRESGENIEDYGRRMRVKPSTRKEYLREHSRFSTLAPSAESDDAIDQALDGQLTTLFFAGCEAKALRYRYYGVRWARLLTDLRLPLAKSNLDGLLELDRR